MERLVAVAMIARCCLGVLAAWPRDRFHAGTVHQRAAHAAEVATAGGGEVWGPSLA
jgi:hypothetical protein